jgi:hypothetical protein
MGALEELPGKDKDLILPIIPLKGWSTSKKLSNSLERVIKAIDNRPWIASIDRSFLTENKFYQLTGKYQRDVFYELELLLSPKNGYQNWCEFVSKIPNAIPSILLYDRNEVKSQISALSNLDRGIVFIVNIKEISKNYFDEVTTLLSEEFKNDIYVIFDTGTLNSDYDDYVNPLVNIISETNQKLPRVSISVSGTSFPSSFSGSHYGENPILERLLFNKVKERTGLANLLYSDRGSARIEKQNGGGGIPSPRIDYPLKNDWRFVRNEYFDAKDPKEKEKEELYKKCALELMAQNYWMKDLYLWGTQMIELTAKGEKYSINSPQKSTAVRINIHLYTQLHYNDNINEIDTDEEWED